MNVIGIVGVAAVTIATAVFIKQYRPEIALVIAGIGGVLVLMLITGDLIDIQDTLNGILEEFNVNGAVFAVVIKALGVCVITDFTANTCRDFGHSALSSGVEFAGKVVVVVLSLPIIAEIAETAVELIK